ncbi:MAG: NfeD family protein [Synechococcales cyanobacterium T60_A2020_003]|nr:NfeD family protein [Synechococcales cyanobacterium T60_A2020_003]
MSLSLLWLIVGVILCLMEFVLPTAFIEFTLGLSALIVAAVALVAPQVSIQIAIWLVLSVVFTILVRRFVPTSKDTRAIADATDATTLTEIPAGMPGRVLYEGNSWQARCDDPELAIAPNEAVYVVGRRGNTLLVMPIKAIQ